MRRAQEGALSAKRQRRPPMAAHPPSARGENKRFFWTEGRSLVVSWLKCERCGGAMPVQRQRRRLRKRNHVKTMWCPWCKRVTQHRERF